MTPQRAPATASTVATVRRSRGAGARGGARGRLRIRGFTLIELLVCLGILGFLASLALPMAEMTAQREKERELKRALWEIRDALDAYRAARESGAVLGPSDRPPYPESLQSLTREVADARTEHQGQTIRFLRRVPRDPFAEPGVPAEQRDAVVTYVEYLRSAPTPGGLAVGGIGPVPEGFVAWMVGMGLLGVIVVLVGRSWDGEDRTPCRPPA